MTAFIRYAAIALAASVLTLALLRCWGGGFPRVGKDVCAQCDDVMARARARAENSVDPSTPSVIARTHADDPSVSDAANDAADASLGTERSLASAVREYKKKLADLADERTLLERKLKRTEQRLEATLGAATDASSATKSELDLGPAD